MSVPVDKVSDKIVTAGHVHCDLRLWDDDEIPQLVYLLLREIAREVRR